MNITINYERPREVKNPCLRKEDIKSPKQLMKEMLTISCNENDVSAESDNLLNYKIVELAKQIINTNERNHIAEINEKDIDTVKTIILSNTTKSDLISYDSCRKILSTIYLVNLQKRAITMALRDLCKEGYLKEKRISAEKRDYRGRLSRVVKTVYEVI